MKLLNFWNGKVLGIPGALYQLTPAMYLSALDFISSKLQLKNLQESGEKTIIQCKTIIRYPQNITLKNNVHIGRGVEMSSEISKSTLVIGEYSQISKNCYIDYSGNLNIGENCTISEGVMIHTHSHGLNPKSKPLPLALKIKDNVWIGANATILQNVSVVGTNSIIASCAVVTKDVPENVVVAGNPAKIIRKLNED
jgi:acetyltransferase-like isoleucine patch superfamily enzyme